MIATIESNGIARYGAQMRTFAIRLITLLALLLMPFGMAVAPADSGGQHHSAVATATDHCPDQQSDKDLQGGLSDCAMPCSAALAAAEPPVASMPDRRVPVELAVEGSLSGIELEIATPPPKHS